MTVPAKRPVPVDVESHRQYAQRVLAEGILADPYVLARDIVVLCDTLERERAGNAEMRRCLEHALTIVTASNNLYRACAERDAAMLADLPRSISVVESGMLADAVSDARSALFDAIKESPLKEPPHA